jgi:hypothetical protein
MICPSNIIEYYVFPVPKVYNPSLRRNYSIYLFINSRETSLAGYRILTIAFIPCSLLISVPFRAMSYLLTRARLNESRTTQVG